MDVAITGASGLIGSALADALRARGDTITTVGRGAGRRRALGPDGRARSTATGSTASMPSCTSRARASARRSGRRSRRTRSSRAGCAAPSCSRPRIAGRATKPAVLVSGSAIGFYGDRGDEMLTEASPPPPPGNFLSDVCVAWEAATANAEAAGIRTVHLRTGIVLSKDGGALAPHAAAVQARARRTDRLRPPVHELGVDRRRGRRDPPRHRHADGPRARSTSTGPAPVTNAEFTKALGAAVHRPTVLPTPLAPLKVVYGAELVQRVLVEGQRVLPAALEASGYEFRHPTIEAAFAAVLA